MSVWKRLFDSLTTPSAPAGFNPGGFAGSTTDSDAEPGVAYAPEIDGEPDPGEVVWAWVAYEDDPSQGKDRPVLLLARVGTEGGSDETWLGLMLSSQDHDLDAEDEARYGRYWMDVGTGGWDREGRPSEVRLDRLLRLRPDDIRREGAALVESRFNEVVAAAREHHALD
ncbi:type II toxin-antitoxin system PemK/MazF family toxin [Nocardioides bigeumensis]